MKLIRFDLAINGAKVRNLDELRANFTAEILELYTSGVLLKWIRSRNLGELEQALLAITPGADADLLMRLCELFDVEADAQVVAAALGEPVDGGAAPVIQPLESWSYREKYGELVRCIEALKRGKRYATQEELSILYKTAPADGVMPTLAILRS